MKLMFIAVAPRFLLLSLHLSHFNFLQIWILIILLVISILLLVEKGLKKFILEFVGTSKDNLYWVWEKTTGERTSFTKYPSLNFKVSTWRLWESLIS